MPFCGKPRKRKSQKNEPLKMCLTIDGCKTIINAAKTKCDATILGLGESLNHSFLCTNGWYFSPFCDVLRRSVPAFACIMQNIFLYSACIGLQRNMV